MKNLIFYLFILSFLMALVFTGTSCEELTDPCAEKVCLNGGFCDDGTCICINGYTGSNCQIAPTVIPPCEMNNTGTICYKNNSTTGRTHEILLNGVRIMTLAPGQEQCKVVAAGQHLLQTFFANSSQRACTPDAQPIIPQCSIESFSCSG